MAARSIRQKRQIGVQRKIRSLRVDDETWDNASAAAEEMGTNITGLIVAHLKSVGDLYVKSGPAALPRSLVPLKKGTVPPPLEPGSKRNYRLDQKFGDPDFVPRGKRRGTGKTHNTAKCDGVTHLHTRRVGTMGLYCLDGCGKVGD